VGVGGRGVLGGGGVDWNIRHPAELIFTLSCDADMASVTAQRQRSSIIVLRTLALFICARIATDDKLGLAKRSVRGELVPKLSRNQRNATHRQAINVPDDHSKYVKIGKEWIAGISRPRLRRSKLTVWSVKTRRRRW
jgi:hypothetical protein